MATPQYRLTTPAFFAPYFVEAGKVVEFDGPPGPHMEPMNDEAKAKVEAYYKERPDATLNPVESIPLTVNVLAPPSTSVEQPFRVPGMVEDSEGFGSNGKSIEGTVDSPVAARVQSTPIGDPADPGKGADKAVAEQTKGVQKANENADNTQKKA